MATINFSHKLHWTISLLPPIHTQIQLKSNPRTKMSAFVKSSAAIRTVVSKVSPKMRQQPQARSLTLPGGTFKEPVWREVTALYPSSLPEVDHQHHEDSSTHRHRPVLVGNMLPKRSHATGPKEDYDEFTLHSPPTQVTRSDLGSLDITSEIRDITSEDDHEDYITSSTYA